MANSTIVTAFAAILVSIFIVISFLLAFYLWRTRSKYFEKPIDLEKQVGSILGKPQLGLQIPDSNTTSETKNFQSANTALHISPFDTSTVINDSASTLFYNKTMTSATTESKTEDKPFICISYDENDDDSTDYDSDHFEEKTKLSSYGLKSSKISAKMMAERHQTLLNSQGPRSLSMFDKNSNPYLNNYPYNKMSSYFSNPPQTHSNPVAKNTPLTDYNETSTDIPRSYSKSKGNKTELVYTSLIYDLYAEKIENQNYSMESKSIGSVNPPPVPLKDAAYLTRPNRTLHN